MQHKTFQSRWVMVFGALLLSVTVAWGANPKPGPSKKDKTADSDPNRADSIAYLHQHQQRIPLSPRPETFDVKHFTIFHSTSHFSAHPRQCPFKYLGGGEILMGFTRATTIKGGSRYEDLNDVEHGFFNQGYKSRGVVVIRRSTDWAVTWPEENESVVYESRMPVADKRVFLGRAGSQRENFDMFRPESLFYFGRAFLPEDEKKGGMGVVCFVIRSSDKGQTWEEVPAIIHHPFSRDATVHKDAYPVIRMSDGKTLVGVMTLNVARRGPAVFASTDQGQTWESLSQPVYDAREPPQGRFTYANLLRRPNGDLHCYCLHIDEGGEIEGLKNAIAVSISKDGGKSWSEPAPIVGNGQGCWKNSSKRGTPYRSPWPIQLSDGRIVVLFARRRFPCGIGGVVSGDDGKTWSHEFVLRDDASTSDLGYPVGCQMDDGRIFTGYYYTLDDGNAFGGTRFIAGSTFRLK